MVKIQIGLYLLLTLFSGSSIFASPSQPTLSKNAMVVSEQRLASQIGVDILHAGGNAIDAAVAMGYALAVVNPCCGNIGGGGFMTIHLANGKNVFLNFREKAPLKAYSEMFLDKENSKKHDATTTGYLAVAVPGTVLGLDTALQKYGTMTRQQVMAPAIQLAKEGYKVTPYESKTFANYAKDFSQQPEIAAIFLKNGQPYRAGERLIQNDLANTLQGIANNGPRYFYQGPVAQAIVKSSEAQGGILAWNDFAKYNVQELTPIKCSYHHYTLISAPPPSSGGITLCEMLNILENFPLQHLGYHTAASTHVIVEAMRYGFIDRNTKLGDPDFVKNPVAQLISKTYAVELSKKIRHSSIISKTKLPSPQHELTDTTHYSVIDNKGNAVAVTTTLNGFFGARVIANHTGFFLNNEMDDFATHIGRANKFGLVQQQVNAIQPKKRPLSSMTPTIIMQDGRVMMILGSPGGPRIITAVLLAILNVIDYKMAIQQAIDAPRFHYQVEPDEISMEPLTLSSTSTKKLEHLGYRIITQQRWAAVEAILIDSNGTLYGANDYRRPDGAAIGY